VRTLTPLQKRSLSRLWQIFLTLSDNRTLGLLVTWSLNISNFSGNDPQLQPMARQSQQSGEKMQNDSTPEAEPEPGRPLEYLEGGLLHRNKRGKNLLSKHFAML
jgi:hypothetical protein